MLPPRSLIELLKCVMGSPNWEYVLVGLLLLLLTVAGAALTGAAAACSVAGSPLWNSLGGCRHIFHEVSFLSFCKADTPLPFAGVQFGSESVS